ncbi:MAG: hypothetical protein QOI74_3976, partial [Micromonosporaceae bacterium]|nr:hypothetical protein [Micromonosporaceae bacterium]
VGPEDLAAANVIGSAAWGTMAVVAASLGGLLAAVAGPYVCFGVTAVCLVAATVLVWPIRRPMRAPGAPSVAGTATAIREALRYIAARPRVASLVTVKSAVGVGNGVLTTFPVLAASVFSVGAAGTGALFGARGLGALIGPMLLRRVLLRRSWLLPGIAVSMAAYGVAYLAVAGSPWFWLVVVFVVLAHVAGGGNWALSSYALQVEVPDGLRGRVFATDIMITTVAISVSQLVVGALVDRVSSRLLIACCGGVTLTYAVLWRLLTRRIMRRGAAMPAADPVVGGPPAADPVVPGA